MNSENREQRTENGGTRERWSLAPMPTPPFDAPASRAAQGERDPRARARARARSCRLPSWQMSLRARTRGW
jgi:hypothetical protein